MQGPEVERGPPTPLCRDEDKWEVRAEQRRAPGLSSVLIIHGANNHVNKFSFIV